MHYKPWRPSELNLEMNRKYLEEMKDMVPNLFTKTERLANPPKPIWEG